jgi:hypothetical protein
VFGVGSSSISFTFPLLFFFFANDTLGMFGGFGHVNGVSYGVLGIFQFGFVDLSDGQVRSPLNFKLSVLLSDSCLHNIEVEGNVTGYGATHRKSSFRLP